MAYDPNDPADKAIVDGLIEAALETLREQHEGEVEGLKNKNKDLLERIRKARAGDNTDTGEIERLERELEEVNGKLRIAQTELRDTKRQLTAAQGERDTVKANLETETSFSRNMLIENGLTSQLAEVKVAPQFLEAAKALLGKGVAVKEVDGERGLFVGDKSLGDYVKEWAASEAGKHYVLAPASGGGGAPPAGGGGGGPKKLAEMTEAERLDMSRTNPAGWQALLKENNITV